MVPPSSEETREEPEAPFAWLLRIFQEGNNFKDSKELQTQLFPTRAVGLGFPELTC